MLAHNEEDLEALAETCLSTARQIKQYLAANGHAAMTFDQSGPSFFPPTATPEIQHVRLDLRAAAKRLYDLASGPDEVLTWHSYHCVHDLNAFRYVQTYKVAAAVPHDDTISYTDLARKLSLDASQLKQMLRQLMQLHVFAEPSAGEVSHTASSRLLTHWGVGAFNEFIALDTFPAAARQLEALESFGHGRPEPNKGALNFYYDTETSMYEFYESRPEVRDRFSRLMTYMSRNPVMANAHVASGFDWARLPADSIVVDVAGNAGHCAVAIAETTNQGVRVVVQDMPSVVAKAADPATSVVPEALRPRVEFMAHDMFTAQPVKGAAVYFLRMILHDYSDEWATRILRAIVPSMAPHSRIVIMDQVLPPGVGIVPAPVERMMRTQDLQMMMLTNAKERDANEWAALVARAGEGIVDAVFSEEDGKASEKRLAIINVQTPPGSVMSLIEVGFVDAVEGKGKDI